MPYFTKNGSIPKTTTDGSAGWVLVPEPPSVIPEGKELVWLNWEWIIRDPRPADEDGHQANWDHGKREWVQCPCGLHEGDLEVTPEVSHSGTPEIVSYGSSELFLSPSSGPFLSPSAGPTLE